MIKLKFKNVTLHQHQHAFTRRDILIHANSSIIIGRQSKKNHPSQLLVQKQQTIQNTFIDLGMLSQEISKRHAKICLSFGWRASQSYIQHIPTYLKQSIQLQKLPENILYDIWQFIRPNKVVLLRDLNSTQGIFIAIHQEEIHEGDSIKCANSSQIVIERVIKEPSEEIIKEELNKIQKQVEIEIFYKNKYLDAEQINQLLLNNLKYTFYIQLSYEGKIIILLLGAGDKYTIGRMDTCDLIINNGSISRKHAFLECFSSCVKICDGNGFNKKSQNGIWKKVKQIQLQVQEYQNVEEKSVYPNQFKLGNVLVEARVIENPMVFNFDKMFQNDQSSPEQETVNEFVER